MAGREAGWVAVMILVRSHIYLLVQAGTRMEQQVLHNAQPDWRFPQRAISLYYG